AAGRRAAKDRADVCMDRLRAAQRRRHSGDLFRARRPRAGACARGVGGDRRNRAYNDRAHSPGARLGTDGGSELMQLTHTQYDELERAITDGRRVAVWRRGTEYVVIPLRLRIVDGHEEITARHPTTGEDIVLRLDEMDSMEPVGNGA